MAQKYDHTATEKKWQDAWAASGIYEAHDSSKNKEKCYVLDMFPYPSGSGLHAGHVEGYTATDIYARFMRMQGKNVLHPMGWDAFGLPAENYAIKTGTHPRITTEEAITNFRRQIKSLGLSYDWTREVGTHTPEYYKWTQWFFLLMYKNGLAEKRKAKVNWCPSCQTVLANEQVVDGKCERCGTEVVQKDLEQWFFKITKYAEDLLDGLDTIDWPESTKTAQRNWIGKSEGAEITFQITANGKQQTEGVTVFTTRPDTLFGATYLVLAPEHPLVAELLPQLEDTVEVESYIKTTQKKTDLERAESKEKTGVELQGIKAVNPANGEEIPVWIADYVIGSYGTGAIMAVPAHDERDLEFAQKMQLPIRHVVMPSVVDTVNAPRDDKPTKTRRNVHAIVYDPKRNAYLALHSKKHDWKTIVIGGIEDGETALEAAKREVCEETGYTDIKFCRALGGPVEARYFAKHKDENRISITEALYFTLESEARVAPVDHDGDVIWVSPEDFVQAEGKMINSELPHWLTRIPQNGECMYQDEGVLVNSGEFDGMKSDEAKRAITEYVGGQMKTTYRLRDWLVSRQRYWGAPIPMILCDECGTVPVPEEELPVILPEDVDFVPHGESPLAISESFHEGITCPKCGGAARRESDTMDTFVCSSWYYYRFTDPKNTEEFASKEQMQKWLPVDIYVGGAEHTVLHLLYSRFFTKVLQEFGYINFNEPFLKLRHQGMILAEDGRKMSKSLGNVVNPDEVVEESGADALRMYEMFMGPLEDAKPWNTKNISGVKRFLDRVWRMQDSLGDTAVESVEVALHKMIKKVGEDIAELKYNTAISAMMIGLNEMEAGGASREQFGTFVKVLAPFAPHMAEELWVRLGNTGSVHLEQWPEYDENKLVADTVNIAVQINGKVRATIEVPADIAEDELKEKAREAVPEKWLVGKEIKKEIVVPGRLVSFVVV